MNDPIRGCDVYKNIGCAHIDGFLCDYPNCSILKEYKMNQRIQDLTNKELQEIIDLYGPITEHNTIAKIIVDLYQEELNERTN